METLVKIAVYTIFTVLCLVFVVWANSWTNDRKTTKCEALGGTILLNITDANKTTCLMPEKAKDKNA